MKTGHDKKTSEYKLRINLNLYLLANIMPNGDTL